MNRLTIRSWVLVCLICMGSIRGVQARDLPRELAQQAHQILDAHCHRCHGKDGAVEGGFNYVLDLTRLQERKKVVPGKPDDSPFFKKIASGKMPPPGEQPQLSEEQIALLRRWIEAGAPPLTAPVARPFVREAVVMAHVVADLDKLERRSRRFARYFSLANLANAGLSDDEIQTYRNALAKLLNSLSWHPRITLPVPIDADKLIYRIDLRDFQWDANSWNRTLAEYPYGVFQDTASARAAAVATGTRLPVVRGDWFVATASRAPLYHDLLLLPNNATELERQLRVDVQVNLQQERVARAGFNGSGISRNNRLIERHDGAHGAYWRTYDFEAVPQNLVERTGLLPDRRNLFAYPFGPGISENQFQHAGGEIIFNLPNGLQGYMLVNANNLRIDKGPVAIVSDPKRPDRAVETAVSCMACHYRGLNPKADQIRDHVEKNAKAFSKADQELVKALYVSEARMKALMDEDAERFRQAVEKTGNKITAAEPVMAVTLRYEADLDLAATATELNMTAKDLLGRLIDLKDPAGTSPLPRNLGALKLPGGTVARQLFVLSFGDLVKELKLGVLFNAGLIGQTLPDNSGEIDPLEAQSSPANAVAFSPDGKRALIASADKTLRLWDTEAEREVRRLIGHTASVWSVAFSPDGTRALSGSVDGTVRLWDTETGREVRRFVGHEGLVGAVAFSPDGQRALSGGYDHAVIFWDLATGQEMKRWSDLARYVNAVTFLPRGDQALVAGEGGVRLVDLKSGADVRAFEGHDGAVVDLAVSGDGHRLLSAGDDGTIRLWDVQAGRVLRSFAGHVGPVKSVAFAPDGKRALSGGTDRTVLFWDVETGKELKRFGKHDDGVVRVAFSPDGRQSLSASRDAVVLPWTLVKAAAPEVNPNQTVASVPTGEFRPAGVIPVGGTVGGLFPSPDGKTLFLLNLTASRIAKIDGATLKKVKEARLDPRTETLAMSPDGQGLYALAVHDRGGAVQVLDPDSLELRKTVNLPTVPYDLAARDDGTLFVTGGSGEWTDVTVVNALEGKVVARWGGVWVRSLVRLTREQDRLILATNGVSPGTVEVWTLPKKLGDKPEVRRFAAPDRHPLGGEFVLSPDGRFLLSRTGTVLALSSSKENDLKPVTALPPFISAAVSPDKGMVVTVNGEGRLRVFSYPDFQERGSLPLGVVPFHALIESQSGHLVVAGFDPKESAERSRARGFGQVYVYPLTGLR